MNYYNGSSGYKFTWKDGRRLATATKGGVKYSFNYNDEGIRTSKTVGGVKHTYVLDGSRIVSEQWDNKLMVFVYDESGAPIAIHYRLNGSAENVFYTYYLEKNLQGDVIAVYDSSGTQLVGYTYDSWGNCTTTYYNGGGSKGAQFNPFRYRGYYYDSDLGLYYLNSRYYDSNTGRFINADGVLNGGVGLTSYNLFAYCSNNSIKYTDCTGYAAHVDLDADGDNDLFPTNDLDSMAGGGTYQYSVDHSFSSKSGNTYYHATTYENAISIKSSQTLKGSSWEGGHVYAWTKMPSNYAIKNSGARSNVVISFDTSASFIADAGINNPRVTKFCPVVSSSPGPISVWNVTIIRGK